MELKFRALNKDEVECRIATINEKGASLLLYKDARCDMNILDETVGATNWQRHHCRENANCIISIWDEDKKQWIEKEDTGTESYTEKEKGLASDSFKRAGFCWGIGRELYTAPFIWVKSSDFEIENKNGKFTTSNSFSVSDMKVENGKITMLEIYNNKLKKVVYTFGKGYSKSKSSTEKQEKTPTDAVEENTKKLKISVAKINSIKNMCKNDKVPESKICEYFSVTSLKDLTEENYTFLARNWSKEFKG